MNLNSSTSMPRTPLNPAKTLNPKPWALSPKAFFCSKARCAQTRNSSTCPSPCHPHQYTLCLLESARNTKESARERKRERERGRVREGDGESRQDLARHSKPVIPNCNPKLSTKLTEAPQPKPVQIPNTLELVNSQTLSPQPRPPNI